MSSLQETLKEYKKIIVSVFVFITMGALTVVFDGVDTLRGIIETPAKVVVLEKEVEILSDAHEMFWEFARDITDNHDSLVFYDIVDALGRAYEVDIRWNNEMKEFGFVNKIWTIYPIGYGPNGRMFVMLHDDADQNTYLYKKQP